MSLVASKCRGQVPRRQLLGPLGLASPSEEPYQVRCHPKGSRAQRPGGPWQPDLAVCTPPPTPRPCFPTCLSKLSGRVRARAVPEYTLRDRPGAVAVPWGPRSVRYVLRQHAVSVLSDSAAPALPGLSGGLRRVERGADSGRYEGLSGGHPPSQLQADAQPAVLHIDHLCFTL